MTDIREKLADVLRGSVHFEAASGVRVDDEADIADAIIAALPGMVEPLVWDGLISGSYEITVLDGGIAGVHYHGNRDEDGDPEYLRGGYLTLVSMDDLRKCANTHHRKQVMKSFGVELDT